MKQMKMITERKTCKGRKSRRDGTEAVYVASLH